MGDGHNINYSSTSIQTLQNGLPELKEFQDLAEQLFRHMEGSQPSLDSIGLALQTEEKVVLPNLLEGDFVYNLASLLGTESEHIISQLITDFKVTPIHTEGISLGNDVLEHYARFDLEHMRLGWIPLQKIGPGIVFVHFLPNAPFVAMPDFLCSRAWVTPQEYLALYEQFLMYDQAAIRSEYRYHTTKKDWAPLENIRTSAYKDVVRALKAFCNEHGHDYEKLRAAEALDIGETEETALDLLEGQLSAEYNTWMLSKLSARQNALYSQLGLNESYLGVIDPRDITYTAQEEFPSNISVSILRWLETQRIVLIYIKDSLVVAGSPSFRSNEIQDKAVEMLAGFNLYPVLCAEKSAMQLITQRQQETSAQQAIKTVHNVEELRESESDAPQLEDSINLDDTEDIRHFVNRVIAHAIEVGASDIHFDPSGSAFIIRYRLDGILHQVLQPFRIETSKLVLNRIKAQGELDLSKAFIPQSGRARVSYRNRPIDLRIEILPVQTGMSLAQHEKAVIRILDPQGAPTRIEDVMWDQSQRNTFGKMIQRPYGCIIVTGPTGSGKSTTLYSAINELNSIDRNILTAEDPVERKIAGVSQVQVSDNLGFPAALRSFLRADPDIILIGEIRDELTARLVTQASQTGHLVFTTLHTNTALGAIPRLDYLGVKPFEIASSLLLLTGQRLVRKLCMRCRMRANLNAGDRVRFEEKEVSSYLVQTGHVYSHRGCNLCAQSGYRGRVAIMEMLEIDLDFQRLISHRATEPDLADLAKQKGFRNMYVHGLEAAARGFTDLTEVGTLVDSYF